MSRHTRWRLIGLAMLAAFMVTASFGFFLGIRSLLF
jgi:hypothetical protein